MSFTPHMGTMKTNPGASMSFYTKNAKCISTLQVTFKQAPQKEPYMQALKHTLTRENSPAVCAQAGKGRPGSAPQPAL